MLNRKDIINSHKSERIKIEPFEENQLRGPSYVLRLGKRFRRWKISDNPINLWEKDAASTSLEDPFESATLVLQPQEFLLATTLEKIKLPLDLVGIITPLSHVARFGIGVTGGSDFINPGHGRYFGSPLTLELFNYNSNLIKIHAGIPIARLRLMSINDDDEHEIMPSIYDGADPVCSPRLFEEWCNYIIIDN